MSAAKGASPKPMPPSSPSNVSASTVLARGVMAKEVLYTLAVFGAEGLLARSAFGGTDHLGGPAAAGVGSWRQDDDARLGAPSKGTEELLLGCILFGLHTGHQMQAAVVTDTADCKALDATHPLVTSKHASIAALQPLTQMLLLLLLLLL
eukprot:CAMPEP_0202373936 /NCGR_PEP_ID=MMETSP1127-20130417/4880_1 /ASSEMBLY_ACC=CAM_ASM_000462 /TAXON_ID=3047 /ORGANISM="Dunaliella tertiolecta, Strain CCMP1320" /LENGTH=149 /DNA_ID=CAMNT_0048970965 /DNA_START=179 /DNA_END=626 /DNA_ORIENTATION=-